MSDNGITVTHRPITVAHCSNSVEAHIIASQLEAQGIDCYIRNEQVSNVTGLQFLAGIEVQVIAIDAERARDIINSEVSEDESLEGEVAEDEAWGAEAE